jgi:hypothetical protein
VVHVLQPDGSFLEFDTSIAWTCVGSDSACSLNPYNCSGMPTKQWMSNSTCGTGATRVGSNSGAFPWTQVTALPYDTDFIWVYPVSTQSVWCKVQVPYDSSLPNSGCLSYPDTTITIAAYQVSIFMLC